MTTQQRSQAGEGVASPVASSQGDLGVTISMMDSVPDADELGGGQDGILSQLAAAASPEDLNSPWRSGDLESLLGEVIIVTAIHKRRADYQSALPWYLVASVTIEATGEQTTVTTGSVNVVGQLVVAHVRGWLPMRVRVDQAAKPTARGFYPQHLTYLPKAEAQAPDDDSAF